MYFRKERRSIGRRLVALLCAVALVFLMVPPEALTAIAADGEDSPAVEVSYADGTALESDAVIPLDSDRESAIITCTVENEEENVSWIAESNNPGRVTVVPHNEENGAFTVEVKRASDVAYGKATVTVTANCGNDQDDNPIVVSADINFEVHYTLDLSVVFSPQGPIMLGDSVTASLEKAKDFDINISGLQKEYSWTDGETESSINPTSAGKKTVEVTVTDPDGVLASEELDSCVFLPDNPIKGTIIVKAKPEVTAEFVDNSDELTYGDDISDLEIRFTSTVAGTITVGEEENKPLESEDNSSNYAVNVNALKAGVKVETASKKSIEYTFKPDDSAIYEETTGTFNYTVAKLAVEIYAKVPDKDFDGSKEVKEPEKIEFALANGSSFAYEDNGEINLKNVTFKYDFDDSQAQTVLNGTDTNIGVEIVCDDESGPVLELDGEENTNYAVNVLPNSPKLCSAKFNPKENVDYIIQKADYTDNKAGINWYGEKGVTIEIAKDEQGDYREDYKISTDWHDGFGKSIVFNENGKFEFYIKEDSTGRIQKATLDGNKIKIDDVDPNEPQIDKVEKYSYDNTISHDHDGLPIDFASGSIAYTFTVTDNESGIKNIQYAITNSSTAKPAVWTDVDNAGDGSDSYTFTVSTPAYGFVWVRVVDNVDNMYEPTSSIRAAVVENEAPIITKKSLDGGEDFNIKSYSTTHKYEVTVTDKPTNKFSGIYNVTWILSDLEGNQVAQSSEIFEPLSSPDEEKVAEGRDVTIDLTPAYGSVVLDGEYTVTVTATDFCGNEATDVQPLYFDNTAPEVTVSMKDGTTALNGETIYYSAEHSGITVDIRDDHNPVSYTVTLSQNDNTGNDNTVIIQKTEEDGSQNEDGPYTHTVSITAAEIKEALNAGTLTDGVVTVTVTANDTTADGVNNPTKEMEVYDLIKEGPLSATFTLDSTNPKLMKIESSSTPSTPTTGPFDGTDYYYKEPEITLAFTVEEINLSQIQVTYSKDGIEHTVVAADNTVQIKLSGDGRYTDFVLSAIDMANNTVRLSQKYEHAIWDAAEFREGGMIALNYNRVIDTEAPTATLTFTNCEPTYYGDEDTFYYNDDINVMITGEDSSKSLEDVTLQDVTWKVTRKGDSEDAEDVTVAGTLKEDGKLEFKDTLSAENKYSYEITGADRAGNQLMKIIENISDSESKVKEDATTSYMVVDITSPQVTFNIQTDASQKQLQAGYNNRYYFNKGFTATYSITEANSLDASKINARYGSTDPANYMSGAVTPSRSMTQSGNNYTYTSSADGLYIFDISGTDKAGNPLVLNGSRTTDIGNNPLQSGLTSYVVAVDTVSPTLDLKIGSYYAADLTSDGYHVTANSPYRRENSAELSYTGADKSPVNVEFSLYSSISSGAITQPSGGYSVNASGNFKFNGEQIIAVDRLAISDLAGNRVQASQSVDGRVSNLIYLDVTPPTEDQLTPLVQLVAHESGQGRSVAGVDLYDGTVTVEATVSEPGFQSALTGGKSSGIYAVYYEVLHNDGEDWTSQMPGSVRSNGNAAASGRVTFASGSGYTDTKNETLTGRETVTFTFDAGSFNYNDISIRVWAEDNSGNLLAKENGAVYRFGIDTTAPSIEVSYDNNDAQNGKYFKADRTATVVVRERNFDPSRTVIDTQVGSSGSWVYAAGASANGDDDTWTTTVSYTADGDYTFNVSTSDLLGHRESSVSYGNSVAPQDFTIDKTNPLIEVAFDNEKVRNERYYDAPRTATILITEHNFDSSAAQVEPTASISEGSVQVPVSSAWSSGGDANTATVDFLEDGDYTMTINFTDMAGNEAQVYEVGLFTVDTTPPELTIDGVEDHMAYGDVNVTPSITYHDINYDDTSAGVQISGYKHTSGENLTGSRLDDAFGGSFIGDNIAKLRDNDDIYTATGTVSDLAGNTTTATVVFSVNRFGSNYILGESTRSLVDKEEGAYYTNKAPVLEVTEINVNSLVSHEVNTSLNGTVTDLKEGVDYSINTVVDGWSETNYQIFSDNFEEEGTYVVTLTSTDEADNINTNRAVKWDGGVNSSIDLAFLVDKTAPLVYFTNVAENERYSEDERQVTVNFSDNTSVAKLTLYLDGTIIQELTGGDLSLEGVYEYIAQASNDWQELSVVAVDVAGNESEMTSVRYLLTSNAFIQFFNNVPLLIGSVVGVFAVSLLIFILLKRRKGNAQ